MDPRHRFIEKFGELVLKCSSCGYCQAVCPVFGLTLRPALNARGKMLVLKEVIEGTVALDQELVETLFQCTTCARCAKSCPAGVDVPEIIKQVRKDMVQLGAFHPAFQGLNEILLKQTNIYGEMIPPDFGQEKNKKAEVVFFIGCVGSYRSIDSTRQTLALLDRLNIDYTLLDEVCCSGVLEDVGYRVHENLVNQNLQSILLTGAETVVTACPYCFRTFRLPQYEILRTKDIKVVHLVQFLKDIDFGVTTEKRLTYHDPCDLGRHSGIYEEPREIIQKITPDYVEMTHNRGDSLCCGAGGGMRGAYPSNSIALARARLEEAIECRADILLTSCNSCVQNLSNAKTRYSKLRKQPLEIYNIPEFINHLLERANGRNKKIRGSGTQ
ncbi:MAG: (Fe-S)-binding protein [Deltaproteobacteria bacterium]|nr:(Fe-S)-binding protein [Deltaproteobacteria bacterium]